MGQESFRLGPPEPSLHPVDVGLRTEAHILSELVRRGYKVLLPFGVNQRYDLVIDLDGRLLRAQCKTGRLLDRGVVEFRTTSVRTNTTEILTRGYVGEIELFLVYCPGNDQIYAVPINDAPATICCLRVSPSRNGQKERIRWARDYQLPG